MAFTSEKTSDRPAFIFIGEHPAIDFANTLAMDHGHDADFLQGWYDVVAWLEEAKLADKKSDLRLTEKQGAGALRAVLELRAEWKAVLARLVEGGKVSEDFVGQINRLLAPDAFHETLHREGKTGFHLHRSSSQLAGKELVLAILARQIASFLAEANLEYLRRCANRETCVLYFYDTTKNHRRQWCSVAACGNRHKVAAFRRRQAARG